MIKHSARRALHAVAAALIMISVQLGAQDRQGADSLARGVNIVPLPLIGSTPTFGFLFGFAPGFNWYQGDSGRTTMSSAWVTAAYTTKNQLLTNARGSIFFEGDRWNLHSDMRVMLNSQPTYGLGSGPQRDRRPATSARLAAEHPALAYAAVPQTLKFNHYRVYQTLFRRHGDTRLFYGLGYHLDIMGRVRDPSLNTDTTGGRAFTLTHHYAHADLNGFGPRGYTQSGLSLNAAYDSRNNTINTTAGRYAFASFHVNPEFMGSTRGATQLWLEYRDYVGLSAARPRHLVAFWGYGHFVTGGRVPYLFLPAVGVDMYGRSGRPYTQGRFRGDGLVYGEAEYRFPLLRRSDLLGAVLFVNGTTAGGHDAGVPLFRYLDFGYGGGLRVMLSRKSRANLALDFGFGSKGTRGFFLGLNETF